MIDEHDRRYLIWIKESIERVYAYSHDHPGALSEDGAIRDAIVWRLETIGEATSHLSEELKTRHPSLPWHEMRDELRDRRVTPQRLDHAKRGQPSDGMTSQSTRDSSFADASLARQNTLIPTSDVDLTSELSR